MSEKLSERLEALAISVECDTYTHEEVALLREAAAALRAVEGAATGRVDMLCARDAVVVDEIAEDRMLALHKKRVRLVPLDAAGSAEGVGGG